MQNTLLDLLGAEHILVHIDVKDAKDAIEKLTVPLIETGHVTPGFAEDVWNREQTFPTGLPTQPLAVAIPHADPDHVNRSAVGIGVLNNAVRFAQMGTDGSTFLDAHLIFILAIKEHEKQVELIQQLMTIIQNASLLEELSKASGPAEAFALIHAALTG